MKRYSSRAISTLAVASALLFTACAEPTTSSAADESPRFATTTGKTLLECPTDVSTYAVDSISRLSVNPLQLESRGFKVLIPPTAVPLDSGFVTIRLEVPASNYLEARLTVNGNDTFKFVKKDPTDLPVSVTLSYSRCTRKNFTPGSLTAWYIHRETKTLINDMQGKDNAAGEVSFKTDHFSSYAVAQ